MSLKFIANLLHCNNSEYFELQASTSFNKDGDYIGNFKEGNNVKKWKIFRSGCPDLKSENSNDDSSFGKVDFWVLDINNEKNFDALIYFWKNWPVSLQHE